MSALGEKGRDAGDCAAMSAFWGVKQPLQIRLVMSAPMTLSEVAELDLL
jgi:hypothetical protein